MLKFFKIGFIFKNKKLFLNNTNKQTLNYYFFLNYKTKYFLFSTSSLKGSFKYDFFFKFVNKLSSFFNTIFLKNLDLYVDI